MLFPGGDIAKTDFDYWRDENLKKCMSLLADPVYMASGDQAESFRALVKTSAEHSTGSWRRYKLPLYNVYM